MIAGERPGPTREEQWLRWWAMFLALISIGFALWYVWLGVFGDADFAFSADAAAKDVLLSSVAFMIFWDVRRFAAVSVPMIVMVHVAMPIVLLVTLLGDHQDLRASLPTRGFLTADAIRWFWLGADIFMVVSFAYLGRRAARARYDIRFLPVSGFRALMALAEVLVLREDRTVAPAEVAQRADHYLAAFRSREKLKIWVALFALAYWPVLLAHPPFHIMSADLRQRWIQRRFLDEVNDWLVPRWWRDLRRALIRAAQQLCFMGYYGDPVVAERETGYVPFSRRPGAVPVPTGRPRLRCLGDGDIPGEELTSDIVIVGSGAAGALLAYKLAEAGRRVLVIERGAHVDPSEFTENEADQLARLYADGALTLSKDFSFQVLQGMCVGGSTVVNNAVCFDLPEDLLELWNTRYEAGLDPERLRDATAWVRDFLGVQPLDRAILSPGGARLAAAADGFELAECNVSGCVGSGYCNSGCAFGAKLSALDHTLPRAQREFGDAVRILPDTRVEKVLMSGSRAVGVQAVRDGRRLTIRATNAVVVSAGVIASSVILQRSGLSVEGRAGRGLSFNLASPVTLDFPEVLHAERGIQITHVMQPTDPRHAGLALETWFNPVVAQSLFMPGWFGEHAANMRRYKHMTCLGVVAGSGNDGSVRATWLGGLDFSYTPSDGDFVKLKNGLKLACEIGLRAGAIRAMPASQRLIEIRSERDLQRIDDELGGPGDLSINTSHPQGGNPISRDAHRGVVDGSFRVYGSENVYVCDASVFPTSITVNPQLTVMALAVYAAQSIR